MTFCLGIKLEEGLVGIADTRILSGNECTTARKVTVYQNDHFALFLMVSGLRSLSDKALTYFDDFITGQEEPFDRLFKAVNGFAAQIRRVAHEDKESLEQSGLPFDLHCLMGGQFRHDKQPSFYLVYPQGNWVEIREGTPYQIIGSTGYGKPILDRTLKFGDSMKFALKVGFLAFDSTRISATDVDLPIDVVLYARDSFRIVEHRFGREDLLELSGNWQERLRRSVDDLASDWIEPIFAKLTRRDGKGVRGD
jgi:putative proteasome-type protease